MRKALLKISLALFVVPASSFWFGAAAQNAAKITFSGTARSYYRNNSISGNRLTDTTLNGHKGDTTTAKSITSGYTLFDWGASIRPNKETEITAVMRMRNEFGGFYGGGVSVNIRQLTAKGTIGKVVKYQVGDIFLKQSPYTFWNNAEEGKVNEAEVFNLQRQVVYYENFYKTGNSWRVQGLNSEVGLNLGGPFKQASLTGFLVRNRPTDYSYQNAQLYGGGRLRLMQSENFTIGVNYVRYFDLSGNTPNKATLYNQVLTSNFVLESNTERSRTFLTGEFGRSAYKFNNVDSANVNDGFLDVMAGIELKKQGLTFKLGFKQVGADFFSPGAQTKRINWDSTATYYTRTGNIGHQSARQVTTLDLLRDEVLYNQRLQPTLGTINPLLSNVNPYGAATPNRSGITAEVLLKREVVDLAVSGAFLNELRGIGTTQKRAFTQLRASGNLHLGKVWGWKKALDVTGGYQYENTKRSGDTIESIALTTSLIDAGIKAEFYPKLVLLLGAKIVQGKGNEILNTHDQYNRIVGDPYSAQKLNVSQAMYAAGLNYSFTPNIYLTVQGQTFTLTDNNRDNQSYSMNQLIFLFNMSF